VRIAIVAAMPEEVAPLRARLGAGRLGGQEVELTVTGDGARNARAGAQRALAAGRVGALVVLGVSGALTPAPATADLIVGARVKDEEGRTYEAAPAQIAAIAQATGARPALVMSARKIADTV